MSKSANKQIGKWANQQLGQYAPAAIFLALLVACWQIAALSLATSLSAATTRWLLPSPGQVVAAAVGMRELIAPHIWQTLLETLSGFALAFVAGILFAILIDASPILRRAIYPVLVISQTIPIIAIAPLLVLWFGYGMLPKLIVVGLVCFFPIVVSTADGLRATPQEMTALFQAMGATRWQIFRKVRLPYALPALFSGSKIAVTYSVIGAIFGEWTGASRGLGVFMLRATNSFRTDRLFVAIAITSALSIGLFGLVELLERVLLPWYYVREEEWEEIEKET